MTAAVAPRPREGRAGFQLATLLAIAVFINYVDRGNLATAAPVLATELHFSATQIGILLSSFYWTYAVSQLGAGWLAERYPVQRVIAAGFALWCIATIFTGLASTFAALLALRLLLGLGESVAFPCSSKMLAENVAVDRRGRSNALIAIGLALGPAFGTYVGGKILAHYGWRALFLSLGALSLLWLIPWLTGPARALSMRRVVAASDAASPSFLDIIGRREAIGAGLGHFCANYTFYFVLSWLPFYLVNVRGYSIERMAVIGGITYAMNAVSSWIAGHVGDRLIERGESPHRVYATTLVVSHVAVAVCLAGVLLGGPRVFAVSLLVMGLAFGLATTTLYAVGQLLAGPRAAGRWIGFQGAVGNLAGIVGPAITGFLVDRTGSFYSAFALAVGFSLLGVLAWTIIIPRIAEVAWSAPASVAASA
ncbi:MAG TPA: MFS transporter [Gemmatimonadaceae bacterium]|nr:MFS transporter [Gemmatimonadaceae bacterium]